MTEIIQADRDAAERARRMTAEMQKHFLADYFARHRMEERAAIVAWLRGETGCAWSRDVIEAANAIEAGEHLK